MKSISSFLKHIFTGGILFLLPIVLILILLEKAHLMLLKISAPISNRLPDIIFGFDGSSLIAILLLITICFLGGLLFRLARVKKAVRTLEENILSNIPGYSLIKSLTADAVGEQIDNKMQPVLIKDEETWSIGFLVEENEEFGTVFKPEPPRGDSGEIKIIPKQSIQKLDISATKVSQIIKSFGKGAVHFVK